jgi:hypothetical protein
MAIRAFRVGNRVRITGAFKTPNEVPEDPAAVQITIRTPDAHTVTLVYDGSDTDVTRFDLGSYFADFVCAIPGDHRWAWEGAGGVDATGGGVFSVRDIYG